MIYFDNAATSFPKPKRVIKATVKCIEKYCANPGRSLHPLAIMTSEKVYEARECIAKLVGIDTPECVVFCENATHALNLAIKTTVSENSHVLISDLEHNSVLRPINALRDAGVSYSVFRSDAPEQSIESLIQPNTGYIISSAASNVIGRRIDIKLLSEKEYTVKEFENKYIADDTMTAEPLDINKDGKIDIAEYGANILAADVLSKGTTDPTKVDGTVNSRGFNAILAYTKKANAAAASKLYTSLYNNYGLAGEVSKFSQYN